MSTDSLKSLSIFTALNAFFDPVNHDNFRINSLQIAPGQLKYHSSLSNSQNLRSSLSKPMVERISSLIIWKFALDVALRLKNPVFQRKVYNIELIIHVAGGYSKEKELMIYYIRRAFLADDIAVNHQLLIVVCNFEGYLFLVVS